MSAWHPCSTAYPKLSLKWGIAVIAVTFRKHEMECRMANRYKWRNCGELEAALHNRHPNPNQPIIFEASVRRCSSRHNDPCQPCIRRQPQAARPAYHVVVFCNHDITALYEDISLSVVVKSMPPKSLTPAILLSNPFCRTQL